MVYPSKVPSPDGQAGRHVSERLRQALTDPSLGPLTRTATTEDGAITDRQPLQVKRHSCALLRNNAEVAGVQAESFIRCAHYGMYAVQTAAMPRSRSFEVRWMATWARQKKCNSRRKRKPLWPVTTDIHLSPCCPIPELPELRLLHPSITRAEP